MGQADTLYQKAAVTKNGTRMPQDEMYYYETMYQNGTYQTETAQTETARPQNLEFKAQKSPNFQGKSNFGFLGKWILKFLPIAISWSLLGLSLFGFFANGSELSRVHEHIARIQGAQKRMPGALLPQNVAPTVLLLAKTYKVDAKLIVALMATESAFVPTRVSHTQDYGLMQLNVRTGAAGGLSVRDMRGMAGLHEAMKTLLYMRRRYSTTESNWICRYNVGTKPLTKHRISLCNKYAAKVAYYRNL